MDRFLDDAESMTSPTPAHTLLDRNRLNKPPNPISILSSLNGTADMQNGSPEIGGLVTGDLPQEASVMSTHNHVNSASSDVYAYPGENHDEPEVKKMKLDKDIVDNAVLQDLEKLISTDPVLHSQIDHLARNNADVTPSGVAHVNTTSAGSRSSIRATPVSPPPVASSGTVDRLVADSVHSNRTISTSSRPTAEAVMQ